MALFTFDQLTTKVTADQMKEQIYTYLSGTGISTTAWQAFSPIRAVIAVLATLLALVQNMQVDANRGGFLGLALGFWLTLTAKQVYNVDAGTATFALGQVVAANSGGGVYDLDPGDLIVQNTITKKTYHNTGTVHIGAGASGVLIDVEADEVGSASTATPGQVTLLVTALLGVTVTNISPIVAQDDEQPDALRARCLEKLGSLSPNGAADGISFVARTPALNGGVAVNRVKILPPPGDGTITCVVANSLGPIADVTSIQNAVDTLATPEIATVVVISATAAPRTYATTVYVDRKSNASPADVTAAVKQSVFDYINSLPIGGIELVPGAGKIPWRKVVGAIESTKIGELAPIQNATLTAEVDVALTGTQVATIDLPSTTVTVVYA